MATKRNFSEMTKLEGINDTLVKRQVHNNYNLNSTTTTATTTPILTHPTMRAPLQMTQHNGLDAAQQIAMSLGGRGPDSGQNLSISDRVKPLIPPCKNCNSNDKVIEDERVGAYICTNCGLETGRVIIETAEWRNFGDGKGDQSRVTAENAYTGLEDVLRTDTPGKKPLEQRRLAAVTGYLDSLSRSLGLNEAPIFHSARKLAQQYLQSPVDIIGQSPHNESLAAVCLFVAAFEGGNPIPKHNILAVLQLNEKIYNRTEKRLTQAQAWWAKKNDKPIQDVNPIQDSITHLKSFSKRLSLSKQTLDAASCIIKTAYDLNISRNAKPSTIAASTVLFTLALQERRCNPHELARIANTTIETIRRHANELYTRRTELVPDNFVDPQQITSLKPL